MSSHHTRTSDTQLLIKMVRGQLYTGLTVDQDLLQAVLRLEAAVKEELVDYSITGDTWMYAGMKEATVDS